ncbi:dihydrodipicolinate synthase family protein [Nocardia sp. NPDC051570]|uniref:dihydrodipicolinate synthase family protein n=1 Tax=Nocardia sp. NPDC051570 TaxID=3364324 RepID=UPI00378FEAF6
MYSGIIVPLVTPLDADGVVSAPGVAALIESVRDEVTGLMPTLSSGEGWLLSERQWTDMVALTREHSRGLPVLAGVQLATTAEVVDRARRAMVLGVDGVVVTTPFGAGLTQEAIYEHYRILRESVAVPLFLYNESALSGNSIEVDTLCRICELPDVVGIKESSGSAELTREIVTALPGIPVFEGWENLLIHADGIAGFIGPLANLEPALCNSMLTDPTPQRQAEIDAACERYGLLREDWYRWVKRELCRRGVLSDDTVAERVS